MNTNTYWQQEDPGHPRTPEEETQESVIPFEHDINITEGSEFLDDAIRMKDQPYIETTTTEEE